MSEENRCNNNEKFESLECLIQEYYGLVQNNQDGLPPYATFIDYLEDDEEEKYINRPKKIKELVDKLNDNSDEEKLNAILELWSHGGEIYVSGVDGLAKRSKLIHSVSNTARLQVFLQDGDKQDNKGVVINKDKLLSFSTAIGNYIKDFQNEDCEKLKDNPIKHQLIENTDFTGLIKNNIDSVINEILFWYFYRCDKYPIINSRAKNSRLITNQIFSDAAFSEDLKFNKACMAVSDFEVIEKDAKIYISKQLMLDQLFYSIDEMKSMKKVEEQYQDDKTNEIYKFYKKLWNTIKGAKRVMQTKDLNLFKNIIYHGAPGTGKTYELKQEIKEHLDLFEKGESEFIQFHSAYSYEDFIGGLKPTSGTTLNLEYKNGIFKELCRKAAQYERAYYSHTDWDKKILTDESKVKNEMTLEIDGKGFKLNTKEPILSQFPPFFILIDEINRADLSKVFGELLYAIEDGYRGFENKFKLSNSYMETENTAVHWDNGAYFFVPKNVYIRGTMNDIDRSIDSIDFAFRRRFKWVEKKYDGDKIKEILSISDDSLSNYIKSCTTLNKLIEKIQIADESYFIGHAIFSNIIKYVKDGDIKNITEESKTKLFDNHIEPIIYNYLKMDYGNESADVKKFREDFVK